MGLNVLVFHNVEVTDDIENSDFKAYVLDEDWRPRIKNLEIGKYYKGIISFAEISYPYSSHNRFREKLIKLIDREDLLDENGHIIWDNITDDIPFYELIDFADNEGCLDWETSEILYKDFVQYEPKASKEMNDHEYLLYDYWLKTFAVARHKAVVVFT